MIREHALLFPRLAGVAEVSELRFPVVPQVMHSARQIQQASVCDAIVEPENTEHLVVPAEYRPLLEWPIVQMPGLESKISLHHRYDARIAGGLLILREHFQHDVVRPPVRHARGADPAVRLLV